MFSLLLARRCLTNSQVTIDLRCLKSFQASDIIWWYKWRINKCDSPESNFTRSDMKEIHNSYRLTHLSVDKMAAISQTTFSNAFSWMKIKFYRSLFIRAQLTIFQHWFRWWLGANQVINHYLNQCWPSSLSHICSTRGRWVKFMSTCNICWKITLLNYPHISQGPMS